MATYTYRLSFPPSVNSYWRRAGKFVYVSKQAKAFRAETIASIAAPPKLATRLFVGLELTPPDRRRRDVDNFCKSTLDALMAAGVFLDDSQIDLLRICRLHVEPPGCVDVTITELCDASAARVLVGE